MSAATLGWCAVPAGRQMDAIVAERVMGWDVTPEWACGYMPDGCRLELADNPDGSSRDGERYSWYDQVHPVYVERLSRRGEPIREVVPFLSTDIDAAWMVLATLHGDTERWAAFTTALGITLRGMGATALHELEVSRAAYAICRAALLAWETTR